MWTRIGLALGLLLSGVAPAFADGFVETSGTYTDGAQIRGNRYDVNGALKVTPATLLSGEDQTNNLIQTSGGVVRTTTVASGMVVGGDATMTAVVTVPTGSKTFQGIITGTGAITQTQKLYGGFANPITTTNGELLCTLTLSGTTETSATCPVVTANFPYYAVLTSSTTGTSATGVMKVGY